MADETPQQDNADTCRNPFDSRKREHYFQWVYDEATKLTSDTHVVCGTCGLIRLNNRDYAAPAA